MALLRLRLEDIHEDGVADIELRLRLGMAAVQLTVADDALALGADVDEDLVLVDPDDAALDDIAVLEALDVRVLLGEELLHRRRLGTAIAFRGCSVLLRFGGGRGIRGVRVVDGAVVAGGGSWRAPTSGTPGFRAGTVGRVAGLRGGGTALVRRRGRVARGGLVGDGNCRDGLFGRLVSRGGSCLRLRRCPALLLFGQVVLPQWTIRPFESETA